MVGSMVQFRLGAPDKKNYRRFKIRTVEGIDDFASIAEVVKRRYHRLLEEDAPLPDLVIIDGGRGQLTAARGALEGLGLSLPVIALAKREEEVYLEIRDEAHRFAIAYNRLLRGKAVTGKKTRSGAQRKS
jgi:excinuclease ABC subunit C